MSYPYGSSLKGNTSLLFYDYIISINNYMYEIGIIKLKGLSVDLSEQFSEASTKVQLLGMV